MNGSSDINIKVRVAENATINSPLVVINTGEQIEVYPAENTEIEITTPESNRAEREPEVQLDVAQFDDPFPPEQVRTPNIPTVRPIDPIPENPAYFTKTGNDVVLTPEGIEAIASAIEKGMAHPETFEHKDVFFLPGMESGARHIGVCAMGFGAVGAVGVETTQQMQMRYAYEYILGMALGIPFEAKLAAGHQWNVFRKINRAHHHLSYSAKQIVEMLRDRGGERLFNIMEESVPYTWNYGQ